VPVDYARPAGGTVGLALLRRAAEDPAHRIGTLFVFAGGPGGSGIVRLTELEGRLPAPVTQRFDLVGVDPRGVGRSAALRCFGTEEQAAAVYGQVAAVPVTAGEIASTLRGNRALTAACATAAGPLLAHLSTLDVARDLDRLRAAVGDPALSFLGYSYATLVGATYANVFPGRVRALVLDGNVDPALRTADGMEYLRQRGIGAETVLGEMLDLCAAAGPRCAFSGGDPRAKFAEIRDRLRAGPVTVPGLGTVALSDLVGVLDGAISAPEEYPDLAAALQAVYAAVHPGAAAPPGAADRLARLAAGAGDDPGTPYTGSEAALAVNCLDEPFPRQPAAYPAAARRWERQAPTAGRAEAFSQLACATWPVPAAERYPGPWDRHTANPLLLFGNRHDPATNLTFNRRAAASLGSARLVVVDLFGHTVVGRARSSCADALAARYLVDLALPPAGTVCPADAQPFG
jgi:pimeloyl-ACP methyl ester carboxylesterase